jgi:hypothetical protein
LSSARGPGGSKDPGDSVLPMRIDKSRSPQSDTARDQLLRLKERMEAERAAVIRDAANRELAEREAFDKAEDEQLDRWNSR